MITDATQGHLQYQYIAIDYPEQRSFNEVYGYAGSQGMVHIEGVLLKPRTGTSKTLFFFMHPVTPMDVLPVPRSLAESGAHVLCGRTRYFKNDAALIFEKTLLDFGAWIRHAKEQLGYEKVVLVGWSGGGALSMFYQSQAENPTIVDTPYGDPVDVAGAGLIPADAVVFQAANASRARALLEALDASVRDELNPEDRDPRLDLYRPENAALRPYSADFLAEYRATQLARMRRITSAVRDRLDVLQRRGGKEMEGAFVVHRTTADPRWLDPTVEPNDRRPGWCFSGDPETVNTGPVGLARFCTLRSWLSQWSIDDTRVKAEVCAKEVTVPFLTIENSADDAVPAAQVHEVYDAVASADKRYEVVKGANHYYSGTPELLKQATKSTLDFVAKRGLLDL
jgi:pimeloyl-ACP methyl ester carboxylesterase